MRVYAQPGAKRTEVDGLYDDRLKIRLASPPVDGKANKELVGYVATLCNVAKSRATVSHGEKSRSKVVYIRFDSEEEAQKAAVDLQELVEQ